MTPFRLVRLSAEELLSKEMSEWRKPDAPDVNAAKKKYRALAVRWTIGSLQYMIVSGRSVVPAQGVILDNPNRAADILAHTAWMWMMFHQHPMQMYVSLLPLRLLAGLLLL